MIFSHRVVLDPDIFSGLRKRKAAGRVVFAGKLLLAKEGSRRRRGFATKQEDMRMPGLEAEARPMELTAAPTYSVVSVPLARKSLHVFHALR
jgi:hypothetical protein